MNLNDEDGALDNLIHENMLRRKAPAGIDYPEDLQYLGLMLTARLSLACGDPEHLEVLGNLYDRSQSDLIKRNTIEEAKYQAVYSRSAAIRKQARQFLAKHGIKPPTSRGDDGEVAPCTGCYLRQRQIA